MSLRTKILPKYTDHNGFLMPHGFPVDKFISGLTYVAQAGDLFICTYPKSGTTWMQNIVYLLLHDGQKFPTEKSMKQEIPMLEEMGLEFVNNLYQCSVLFPRIVKTHLPYAMVPSNPESKYIYVVRNPKDVAVSHYFHTKGFPHWYDFAEGQLEDFVDIFLEGKMDWCDYWDHFEGWYLRKNDPNVLYLSYENMLENHKGSVKKIAKFLGVQYDDALLDRVVQHSTFSSMNVDQTRWQPSRDVTRFTPFLRKGKTQDWRNYLSLEQSRAIDERTKNTLMQLQEDLKKQGQIVDVDPWKLLPWNFDITCDDRA